MTGAAGSLRPGTYRVDRTRSAFYLPTTKGFPKNTEVDVTLTFVTEADGRPWRRWRWRSDAGAGSPSARATAAAVAVADAAADSSPAASPA